MKQVFIIHRFDLKTGSVFVPSVYFSSETCALHYVDELKRIVSETLEVELPIVEQRYIFNVIPLDFLQ